MSAEPCEPALFGSAHVLSVGLYPFGGPARRHSADGNARCRRRRRGSSALEGVERSGWIAAWRTPNELDDLLKLAGHELSHDRVEAPLIEQQNSLLSLARGRERLVGVGFCKPL